MNKEKDHILMSLHTMLTPTEDGKNNNRINFGLPLIGIIIQTCFLQAMTIDNHVARFVSQESAFLPVDRVYF